METCPHCKNQVEFARYEEATGEGFMPDSAEICPNCGGVCIAKEDMDWLQTEHGNWVWYHETDDYANRNNADLYIYCVRTGVKTY